tara:strand:- start:1333 stop:1452 length:120 start_codon:yes stop_codon:yes gene_type:complete
MNPMNLKYQMNLKYLKNLKNLMYHLNLMNPHYLEHLGHL